MRNRKAQGFTLIELLIVIAIIGILAAVLIPNLMNARRTAALRAAQAHSSNVYTAFVAALADDMTLDAADLADPQVNCAAEGTVGQYGWVDAPAGATCTVDADGTTDFTVVVTYDGTAYTNGQAP